jgi:hypothetical protein
MAVQGVVTRSVADGTTTNEAIFTDSMARSYRVASALTIATNRGVSSCC